MDFRQEIQRVGRAWRGDAPSLEALASEDADGALALRHRAGPALCRLAEAAGLEPAAVWRQQRLATAGRQMLLVDSLHGVGEALAESDVPWTPIKGLDLLTRAGVYEVPEDRPTSDLDLLIPEDRLADARRALAEMDAQDLVAGPRGEAYLRDEGYAWQAALPSRVLVELHFRLWAQVPAEMPVRMLDEAVPDEPSGPGLPGARRLRAAHAYLLAAVHAFTVPTPRGAGIWRDLAELSSTADGDWADEVAAEARRFDVQLPVVLAAEASATLFASDPCRTLAESLRSDLRHPERLSDPLADPLAAVDVSLGRVTLARHLARRRSRRGLVRAAWRRVWPHPGVVEGATGPGWWPLRRLRHLTGHR